MKPPEPLHPGGAEQDGSRVESVCDREVLDDMGSRGPSVSGDPAVDQGFNNEGSLGSGQGNTVFTRLWIDSELKEAMGH